MTSPSSSIFCSLTLICLLSPRGPRARSCGAGADAEDDALGRDRDDVRRLGALRALAGLELDLRTLGERLEAAAANRRVVDEHVLSAVLGLDEAVALGVVE